MIDQDRGAIDLRLYPFFIYFKKDDSYLKKILLPGNQS
jgi:hypothetical protein